MFRGPESGEVFERGGQQIRQIAEGFPGTSVPRAGYAEIKIRGGSVSRFQISNPMLAI